MKQIKFYLLFIGLFSSFISSAQKTKSITGLFDEIITETILDSSGKLIVDSINIIGNKKTRDYIILREMKVKIGDSISAKTLYYTIKKSRDLIYNTNLFSVVVLTPVLTTAFKLTINVSVIERWYIYPTPQFRLIDRNFNEWWKTYDADLNRVNYGVKFSHFNLSGRGDQLNIYLLNGYSRNFSMSYSSPYSNSKLTQGFSIGAGLFQNREFPYKTSFNNKLLQYKSDNFDRTTLFANGTYSFRKGFYKKHILAFQYNYFNVNDSLISDKYNPNYFNINKTKISFIDVAYGFQYVNTNNINYPLRGKIYTITISKRGLGFINGLNMLSIDASFRKYFIHTHKFYSSIQVFTKLKLPFKQPYINQRAIGYGDFNLNGLEYYVIDGVAAAVTKYTFSKKVFSYKIPMPFKISAVPYIPISLYAKTYANAGFAYNKKEYESNLNNKLLYTCGFGLDILTLYDLKLSVEFSFNQLGEKGLFLHTRGVL